jgi:putative acyl-CoA dehydrogenase
MRRALIEAIHHARHRSAFGRPLIAQPLMQNVLADLALESEAAMALSLRVARAVGASAQDPREAAFARVATALGKYWICKRCPPFVNEAQECLGGAGYVEESILPRLFRQSPLNSIWEGSGNIQCLDVLRALTREPASRDALFAELNAARGGHALLDAAIVDLERELDDTADMESRSRWIAERMALALQAALLVKGSTAGVADVFCNSRLGAHRGLAFGTLQAEGSIDTLIDRTLES